ncbi:hypothetical protein [Paraburkholderia sp. J63]|uniref:hypothetical protein n=1 Tax=Paraburkholderia sp. J63 TaxID=2805434 RepID=UPI002ABDC9A6|nr:hypothetical protein [Paraburkholderia sp. J63]
MFNNLRISARLRLAFGILLLMFTVEAGFSLLQLRTLNDRILALAILKWARSFASVNE